MSASCAIVIAQSKGTVQIVSGRIAKLTDSHAFLTSHGYQPVGSKQIYEKLGFVLTPEKHLIEYLLESANEQE